MTDTKYPVGTVADITYVDRKGEPAKISRAVSNGDSWTWGHFLMLSHNSSSITNVKVLEVSETRKNDYDELFTKLQAAAPLAKALFSSLTASKTATNPRGKPVGDVWADVCDIVTDVRDILKESAEPDNESAPEAEVPDEPKTGGVVTVKGGLGKVHRYARGVDGKWRGEANIALSWDDIVSYSKDITVLSKGV